MLLGSAINTVHIVIIIIHKTLLGKWGKDGGCGFI